MNEEEPLTKRRVTVTEQQEVPEPIIRLMNTSRDVIDRLDKIIELLISIEVK